jgi:hypothetical protein
MDRCEEDWYASDNKFRGTLRGSRKKPKADNSPQAVTRRPRCAVALSRKSCSEYVMVAAWAWHGKCESDTAALCKSLAARHGREGHGRSMGTASYV